MIEYIFSESTGVELPEVGSNHIHFFRDEDGFFHIISELGLANLKALEQLWVFIIRGDKTLTKEINFQNIDWDD